MTASTSPEQSAAQALSAMDSGDLTTAVRHLSRALLMDPHRAEWLALLTHIMDSAEDPLALVPLRSGGISAGEMAVRAYACHRKRRYHDALDLLMQAALAAPQSPLLDWAKMWLRKPETATSINTGRLAPRFQAILRELPRIKALANGGAPLLVRLGPLVRRLRETQVCDGAFLLLAVSLLRQLPDSKEAYEAAREAHELEPGHASCVALGEVYRDREDWDRAARWFQAALDHQPDDVATRLTLGDMLLAANRPDEAEHWYRAALSIDPQHPQGVSSLLAVRYERTGDPSFKDELEHFALSHPENAAARAMIDRISPYFGSWLPEPGEASLRLVRLMVQKWEEGEDVRVEGMHLSSLEAPSVYLAHALQLAREGKGGRLKLDVEAVPRPDVRRPRVPVRYLLWRYRGTEPLPALSEPPARASAAVTKIAAMPYGLKSWLAQAANVAPQFGSGRILEPLAVMVHPSPLPRGVTPWEWVQRVQIAAMLIAAKTELGWRGSIRRQALFDVANGPLDWTTVAAILALSVLADDEPEIAGDVAALFNDMLRDASEGGYICHLHALVVANQRLPNLSQRMRLELAQRRRELERG